MSAHDARGMLLVRRVQEGFIGNKLRKMCAKSGLVIIVEEIDSMSSGKSHDLLDRDAQFDWGGKVAGVALPHCGYVHKGEPIGWAPGPSGMGSPPKAIYSGT